MGMQIEAENAYSADDQIGEENGFGDVEKNIFMTNEMVVENEVPLTKDFSLQRGKWSLSPILIISFIFSFILLIDVGATLSQFLKLRAMESMPDSYSILAWTKTAFQENRQRFLNFFGRQIFTKKRNLMLIFIIFIWFTLGSLWKMIARLSVNKGPGKSNQKLDSYINILVCFLLVLMVNSIEKREFSVRLLLDNLATIVIPYIVASRFKKMRLIFCTLSLLSIVGLQLIKYTFLDLNMKKNCLELNQRYLQKNLDDKSYGALSLLKDLAKQEGFPINNIFFSKSVSCLAFTGYNYYMNIEENIYEGENFDLTVLGDMAHELGHYTNSDSYFSQLYYALQLISFPILVPIIQSSEFLYGSVGLAGVGRPIEIAISLAKILQHILFLYVEPFYLIYSRFREDRADRNAVRLGHGLGLYISFVLDSESDVVSVTEIYKFMNCTHPPLLERLRNLEDFFKKKRSAC